jgi:hypothetical protein
MISRLLLPVAAAACALSLAACSGSNNTPMASDAAKGDAMATDAMKADPMKPADH